MSELRNLIDELRRIHYSDAWHGLALQEILSGITGEQAASRPIPGAHSIWELVLHITGWQEVFSKCLEGAEFTEPSEGDFPPVKQDSENWAKAIERLNESQKRLIEAASHLSDSRLEQPVSGRDYSIGFMFHGLIRHHVYHSGQIGLLKKAIKRND